MAKRQASAADQAQEPTTASEPIEMRADQWLLWQTWCSILKYNAHTLRDARLNLEISQLSITFLVPNPETYPVVMRMLVLDFDDGEVTASLTSFIRKSMRTQGESFHLLREAVLHATEASPAVTRFLAEFGVACPMEQPLVLPPGYCYKAAKLHGDGARQ